MPQQQPGTIEKIFNSTLWWPQQVIWRSIRAANDDRVDLWSERGLADAAMIPFTGMFADHEHDVMPDEMFGNNLGAQIAGSIFTDPMMFMGSVSRGLVEGGKLIHSGIKTFNQASKNPVVRNYVSRMSMKTGRPADDIMRDMTVKDLQQALYEGTKAATRPGYSGALRVKAKHIKAANKLMGKFSDELLDWTNASGIAVRDMGIAPFAREMSKRQLAFGLIGTKAFGAYWSGGPLKNYSSWTKFLATPATATVKAAWKYSPVGWGMSKIPYVNRMQDALLTAGKQFGFGMQVGGKITFVPEAAVGGKAARLEAHAKRLTLEHSTFMDKIIGTGDDLEKNRERIVASYSAFLNMGRSSDEALVAAFQAAGVKDVDSAHKIWSNLTGVPVSELDEVIPLTEIAHRTKSLPESVLSGHQVESFTDLAGANLAPTTLRRAIDGAVKDFRAAQQVIVSDQAVGGVGFSLTEAGSKLTQALKERELLLTKLDGKVGQRLIGNIGRASFIGGKLTREYLDRAFRIGGRSREFAAIKRQLDSAVSQGAATTEELTDYIYRLLPLSAREHGLGTEEFTALWLRFMQSEGIPDELLEAQKWMSKSPEESAAGIRMIGTFLDRHLSSLRPLVHALKARGVTNDKLAALVKSLDEDIAATAPQFDKQRIVSHLDDSLDSVVRQPTYDIDKWGGQANENVHQIGFDPDKYKRVFLGSLSDRQLNHLIEQLTTKGRRKLLPGEINQLLRDDVGFGAEWQALVKATGKSDDELRNLLLSVQRNPHQTSAQLGGVDPQTLLSALAKWGQTRQKLGGPTLNELLLGGATKFDEATLAKAADDAVAQGLPGADYLTDLKRAQELKAKRAAGRTTQMVPEKTAAGPAPVTERTVIESAAGEGAAKVIGEPIGEWGHAYADAATQVIKYKRWLKLHPDMPFDVTMVDEMLGSVRKISELSRNAFYESLDPIGRKIFDKMRELQVHTLHASIKSGTYVPGAPLGYLSHIFTKDTLSGINRWLTDMDRSDLQGVLREAGVQVRHNFGRAVDNMTVEDINRLYLEMKKLRKSRLLGANPERAKQLKAMIGTIDRLVNEDKIIGQKFKLGRDGLLEIDPFLATLKRFGDAQQDTALIKFYDDFLNGGKDGERLVGAGKVLGYYDDQNRAVSFGAEKLKLRDAVRVIGSKVRWNPKTNTYEEVGKLKQQVAIAEAGTPDAGKVGMQGIIVQLDNGEQVIIPADMLDMTGFSVQKLARSGAGKGLGEMEGRYGINSAAKAYAFSASRGELKKSLYSSADDFGEAVSDMGGHYVAWGMDGALAGARSAGEFSLKRQWMMPRLYDSINNLVRGWQTVYNTAFAGKNLVSGIFQTMTHDVSAANLTMGYADTLRLLYSNSSWTRNYKNMGGLLETPAVQDVSVRLLPNADVVHLMRLNGYKGFERLSQQELANLGRIEDFIIPIGGGGEVSIGEVLNAAYQENLFSTFYKDGLRRMQSVSERVLDVRARALDPNFTQDRGVVGSIFAGLGASVGGLPGAAVGGAVGAFLTPKFTRWSQKVGLSQGATSAHRTLAEISEVTNRLSATFAYIRQGHDVRSAVKMAKEAHVPYDELTWFERNVIKRGVLYYTFPRHYIPFAWKKFSENPHKLSKIVNTIRNDQLFTMEEGKPHLKLGDFRIDVGRLNANIEAAMLFAGVADQLVIPYGSAIARGATLGNYRPHEFEPSHLQDGFTLAGLGTLGGAATMINPAWQELVYTRPSAMTNSGRVRTSMQAITEAVWPVKAVMAEMGAVLDKDARSPYLQFTKFEKFVANSNWGLGTRKVRSGYETIRAVGRFQSMMRDLKRRIAVESMHGNQENVERLTENAQVVARALQSIVQNEDTTLFK